MNHEITEKEYLVALKTVRQYLIQVKNELENRDIFKKDVRDCDFSTRTLNAIRFHGVETVKDLVNLSTHDFKGMRNFGKGSTVEIQDFLEAKGLSLGMLK